MAVTTLQTVVVSAGDGSVGYPPPADALFKFVLCDRSHNALADISTITWEKQVSMRLSRPTSVTFETISNHALIQTLHSDGYPLLCEGRRAIKVYRRANSASAWSLYAHCIVWFIEDHGDEDDARSTVTCFDPLMWWRFRPVRDRTGNFISPVFVGHGPDATKISGPDMLRQCVRNSVANTAGGGQQEGDLFLDTYTGSFDLASPPAPDMDPNLQDWPIYLSDLLSLMTDTGACDVYIDPVDTTALGTQCMGVLNAVTQAGNPSSPVHFDYGMGDYSVKEIRRSKDMDTVCNKLWYYLGTKEGNRFTGGNITATDPALPDPPQTALAAGMVTSRAAFGEAMSISIYNEDVARIKGVATMWHRLWQQELALRLASREMLFVTPVENPPFDVGSLHRGDIITINCSNVLRAGFSAQQRVYGWDISVSDENVTAITELVMTADT